MTLIANALAPYVAWGVGAEILSIPFSMLATTLAAMIERPFYAAGGIEKYSFRYSMQANILSWFVGLVIAYSSIILGFTSVFTLMLVVAVPFSIFIESWYLYFCLEKQERTIRFGICCILGNVLSGGVLLAIREFGLEAGESMRQSGSRLFRFLELTKYPVQVAVFVGCALLFIYCIVPKFSRSKRSDKVVADIEFESGK